LSKNIEPITDLICELSRNCTLKEEYFATSFNLTPTEVRLLKLFTDSPTHSIKELCTQLMVTPGRITHILDSLEKKKLISRSNGPSDKRSILVKLMPNANPFIKNLQNNYRVLHEKILNTVDEKELEKILSSLTVLVNVFRKWSNQK
jgi:DNA-binding MarR family transcriptional regulator